MEIFKHQKVQYFLPPPHGNQKSVHKISAVVRESWLQCITVQLNVRFIFVMCDMRPLSLISSVGDLLRSQGHEAERRLLITQGVVLMLCDAQVQKVQSREDNDAIGPFTMNHQKCKYFSGCLCAVKQLIPRKIKLMQVGRGGKPNPGGEKPVSAF